MELIQRLGGVAQVVLACGAKVIEHPPIFHLPWSWTPDHVTYTWLVMIILAGLAYAGSRNLQLVPRGVQNFLEVVLEQFLQMIDDGISLLANKEFRIGSWTLVVSKEYTMIIVGASTFRGIGEMS